MRVIDPGHQYALAQLDGNLEELVTYVKREGPPYPGNIGSHPGTNLQEQWRAQIHRVKYLDAQAQHPVNEQVVTHLRHCIRLLEMRAAERHGRNPDDFECRARIGSIIETLPFCSACGHIACVHHGACHQEPRR